MGQFLYKSATELARLIREGQATSVDILREHLDQIKRHNDQLNALIMIFEDEAIQTAEACDREFKEGKLRGPLHGVPVTVKEQFWIKGEKTTINAKMYEDFVAPEDAVIVDRIKKSGAIILGKTNVPKFLLDWQVWGDIYPDGKNPYNPEYTPGGSTGGGAAALATGMTTLELGADLGGSIRVPANFCGLYGLKPTDKTIPAHGNVALPEDAKTFIMHMAQAGPLARNLEDLELLWNIIVGPHESDRSIPRIEWKTPTKNSLSDYKIAWINEWPDYPVSEEVGAAIENLIDHISQDGCGTKNEGPGEDLHDESLRLWMGLFPYIAAQGVPWFVRPFMKKQNKSTVMKGWAIHQTEFDKGYKMGANHYGEMMLLKSMVTERWEKFFDDYDFLICPMSYGPAYKRVKIGTPHIIDGNKMPYAKYVWPYVGCFNASGHPALNIPLGIGKESLPLGVQIVGAYWSEPDLLNFAKLVSEHTEGFVKPEGY